MKRLLTLLFLVTFQLHAQTQKPNIVFILADDLGIGDLGSYDQQKISTPNLDKLAASGMRFTKFYAGTSVCAPSRSSLLTGQHTGHTHIRGNKEIEPEGQEPLADSIRTFAMILQEQGYTTGAFGKWGLGMVGTSGDPNRKGFDVFFGYNCQRQSHRYYPTHLWHNNQRVDLKGNDLSTKAVYAPALIQEQTLAFIDHNKERPFFLFVPTVLPHAELAGPEDEFYKKYEDAFEEKAHQGNDYGPKATVAGYASVEKPRATFAAMVSRMDHYVGEIIDRLEQQGLLENTIIIFSSDNGAHREGGTDPDFFNSTAGFRGYKRDLYEGGIRTPLLVSWKGRIPAGTTSSHVGAFWDIFPTIQELTNHTEVERTDGISMLPTWLKQGKQKKHQQLYWEFHEDGGRQAVRYKNYKLIRFKVKDPANSYYELYDLEKDPQEKRPLQNPKLAQKILKLMEEQHTASEIFPLLPKNTQL
ncbi:arylsulfatase [Sphingobacterium hotanense]|uniref:arylsulfatase n=1 Tax=Sphingobacterium hotanense TaxID=649196 RepID=UPI0011F0A9A9|nr:arylsulfatase [Sphingobacterium hotanense]